MEKVINLGWAMARLDKNRNIITLVTPSDQVGEGYVPPQCILIQSIHDIKTLKDALNEMWP